MATFVRSVEWVGRRRCRFWPSWHYCQEIEITASGSFSTIYSEIEQNFTGIYKRQLIPLNDNALYYREDEGDQGERQWIAHSGDSEVDDPWILSSNKYALPGSDLGTV